jgi:hypothetical protein
MGTPLLSGVPSGTRSGVLLSKGRADAAAGLVPGIRRRPNSAESAITKP